MIRPRNIDQAHSEMAQQVISLFLDINAPVTDTILSGVRMPYAGTLVAAHIYAANLVDADDSVRVNLKKNATSVLPAAVDPVASDTLTNLAPNATTFVAGDVFKVTVTTAAGDSLMGQVTLVVRPQLGAEAL